MDVGGKHMERGIFITMEGPEGAGKTTILKILGELCKQEGYSVVLTTRARRYSYF